MTKDVHLAKQIHSCEVNFEAGRAAKSLFWVFIADDEAHLLRRLSAQVRAAPSPPDRLVLLVWNKNIRLENALHLNTI